MARGYGFLGGVVLSLSAVAVATNKLERNTAAISRELVLARLYAENRPIHKRPYTEPLNLQTRQWRDMLVDMWDAEILRLVNLIFSS